MAFADGYTCTFTATCYEDSGCKDGNLTIRIIEDGHNQPQMITPGLAFQAIKQVDDLPGIVEGTVSYVSRLERNTVHLLTIFPNGSARFSAHTFLSDALSIEGRGRCDANLKD